MKDRVRAPSARDMSVKDDWRAWLPLEKSEVFHAYLNQLEVGYNMLSVSLNEVLTLRRMGLFAKAAEAVAITADLCHRFAGPLTALLWSLGEHAKHYGTIPNAAPLNPGNFQGSRGQRAARMNALLCRILLSGRAQFLHKISALSEIVADLSEDFCSAAEDITENIHLSSESIWAAIDAAHYDLNTCLREAIVLLKSFLLALPTDELDNFQATVRVQMTVALPRKDRFGTRLLRHRRIASIAGE